MPVLYSINSGDLLGMATVLTSVAVGRVQQCAITWRCRWRVQDVFGFVSCTWRKPAGIGTFGQVGCAACAKRYGRTRLRTSMVDTYRAVYTDTF